MHPLVPIQTQRLNIFSFGPADLEPVTQLLNAVFGPAPADHRASWLEWNIASRRELQRLRQPPYGDYAITLRGSEELIGAIGLVPVLAPFGLLPPFRTKLPPERFTPEIGLFWAIHPQHQHNGYAREAAAAFVHRVFNNLGVARLVACTTRDNTASIRVMKFLGMRIDEAPQDAPHWFQTIGHLNYPRQPN